MRKDSRIAGTLDTGYVVQIIEKKRNWTYVLYSDPSEGVVIEGWTNTKYLKKIMNYFSGGNIRRLLPEQDESEDP